MADAITRRAFHKTVLGAGASALVAGAPGLGEAQERELVLISYGGKLQEPHRWLADRMEKRHPGLKIRLVPSESQDVVAQIKAAQGNLRDDHARFQVSRKLTRRTLVGTGR